MNQLNPMAVIYHFCNQWVSAFWIALKIVRGNLHEKLSFLPHKTCEGLIQELSSTGFLKMLLARTDNDMNKLCGQMLMFSCVQVMSAYLFNLASYMLLFDKDPSKAQLLLTSFSITSELIMGVADYVFFKLFLSTRIFMAYLSLTGVSSLVMFIVIKMMQVMMPQGSTEATDLLINQEMVWGIRFYAFCQGVIMIYILISLFLKRNDK